MTVKFTESHEWVRVEGETATVGITAYAQEQLGDVVFVELPETGKAVKKGGEIAVVESVKAASEVYAPIGGTITETNGALEDDPSLVNSAAETDGWFVKLTLSDAGELGALMDEDGYKTFLEDL